MPHAELKYSSDLDIDVPAILGLIERTILQHDPASGECKGRAYATDQFHHSHVLLSVMMLERPHRDAEFTARLMQDLEALVKSHIATPCYFSFSLDYNQTAYVTNMHKGDAP